MPLFMPWNDLVVHKIFECCASVFVLILYIFIMVYFFKISKNRWTIRAASQYACLLIIPFFNFLLALAIVWYVSAPIMLLNTIILFLNNKNVFHGLAVYDEQGISAVLKKYQEIEKIEWATKTEQQKQEWKEKYAVNPIKFNDFLCVFIAVTPFVLGVLLALLM